MPLTFLCHGFRHTERYCEYKVILQYFFNPLQPAEEEVSGAALLALNDRMVQQLVKKIGHQALLMDLINKYQQQRSGTESPVDCWETASPTRPDVSSG